jgi:hypothetical protein
MGNKVMIIGGYQSSSWHFAHFVQYFWGNTLAQIELLVNRASMLQQPTKKQHFVKIEHIVPTPEADIVWYQPASYNINGYRINLEHFIFC